MSLRVVMIALLLLAAVALGLIAFQVSGPPRTASVSAPPVEAPAAPASSPMSSYLVAARTLPPGTLARPEDFTVRTVPTAMLPPDVVVDSQNVRTEMRGALVRRFLEIGSALRPADVTRPRERGFLAAVLATGTRAVSIGVDPVSGVAGLIWPGDRVDVILTQEFSPSSSDTRRIVTSETIMTDVRIIAVDQDIAQGAPASGSAGKLAATVTLEVTTDQAEKLAVSGRLGRLSLAVRSVGDDNQPIVVLPGGVSGADVSDAFAKASGVAGPKMQVIEGEHRSEVRFK
jgi:pilus assembly protein CpaB